MRKVNSRAASLCGTYLYGRASRCFSRIACTISESFSIFPPKLLLHFLILFSLAGVFPAAYAGNYVPGSCQYGTNTPQEFCKLYMGPNSVADLKNLNGTQQFFDCSSSKSGCLYPNVDTSPGNGACWSYNQWGKVAACIVVACPAHASGTPCVCDANYKLDATGTSCVPNALTITLQGGSTTEPGTNLGFVATVTNQDKQPPANPVKVKISLTVDPKSGGHDHGTSDRPRGGIEGTKCVADDKCWEGLTDNGVVNFKFNPTDASGTHTILATCEGCSNTATKSVDVKVEGLETIPSSSFYSFIGDTDNHSDNHYLTPDAATVLWRIAVSYQMEQRFKLADPVTKKHTVTPPVLRVNDASLKWGGRFDAYGNWKAPHAEHMRGTVVDLRANGEIGAISPSNFRKAEMLFSDQNTSYFLECTKDKKPSQNDPSPPQHKRLRSNLCVSQLDGSQDTNRHYHIRLMGVRE